MIEAPHGLNETAQEPVGRAATKSQEPLAIQRSSPFLVEFQGLHRRVGDVALATGTLRALCKSCFRNECATCPQPRPFESGIGIGRIVDPGETPRLEERREMFPPDPEQRPQEPGIAMLDDRRHAGQTVGPAIARGPHRYGLGLIVGVMGDKKVQDAAVPAGVEQKPITRRAGCGLKTTHRLRPVPVQNLTRNAPPVQKSLCRRGLFSRLGPQSVVHRQCNHFPASLYCPFMSENGERQGITTSGHGNRDHRPGLEGLERRHQGGKHCSVQSTLPYETEGSSSRIRASAAPDRYGASAGRWNAGNPG